MKRILIFLAFILLVCTGCGIKQAQTSADVTISPSPSATVTPEPTAIVSVTPEPTPSASITPEPTVSVSVTPEPTVSASSTPMPTIVNNYKLNSDSIILKSGLKISDLESYFDITGGELLQKLGSEYETAETGIEGTYTGYYYEKLGITLVFNDYDYDFNEAPLIWIECDVDKLELNELTPDMNFKQIQARIGIEKITKVELEEGTGEYGYDLTYKIGNILLKFGSFTKDARDGYWLTVEYNYD